MNTDLKKQIADLMTNGATPQVIGATLGLDVSAVLDVLGDPIVKHAIRAAAAERLENALNMDNLATNIEALALARMYDATARESDPRKLVAIYTAMNKGSKRVPKPEDAGLSQGDTIINLVLPQSAVERRAQEKEVAYEMDAAGQVVSVDGVSLQTMDANRVLQLAQLASPKIQDMTLSKGSASIVRMEDI